MPKRSDSLLVGDMVENAEAIFQFVGDDDYEQVTANR